MKYPIAALVLGFFAALSVAAPQRTSVDDNVDVDPAQVYLEGITYAGTGCKVGSGAITKTQDSRIVTLEFNSFVASIGPGVAFDERRKNCNLNINLHYPGGYQYTLYQIDYTGSANLDVGVTAKLQSIYWFAGFLNQRATLQTTLKGKYVNSYAIHDILPPDAWVWSPCGASTTLNIDTEVSLANDPTTASGTVIDSRFRVIYGVRWRRC
ncbi:hypothetical protein L873DRAFT_1813371 [Choiromyces venosus 120613-1]|uniref:Secreted protein n=1 Tax=Choiromyces venosus 120613-1 TaxID=1336337 RepID=A0A3N4JMS4_9PEZI|nr:hypothetical protein L873DRAFT_1813371 [Choiromyces venosus 120613-1]